MSDEAWKTNPAIPPGMVQITEGPSRPGHWFRAPLGRWIQTTAYWTHLEVRSCTAAGYGFARPMTEAEKLGYRTYTVKMEATTGSPSVYMGPPKPTPPPGLPAIPDGWEYYEGPGTHYRLRVFSSLWKGANFGWSETVIENVCYPWKALTPGCTFYAIRPKSSCGPVGVHPTGVTAATSATPGKAAPQGDLHERVEAMRREFDANIGGEGFATLYSPVRSFGELVDGQHNKYIEFFHGHGFPARVNWDVKAQRWVDASQQYSCGGAIVAAALPGENGPEIGDALKGPTPQDDLPARFRDRVQIQCALALKDTGISVDWKRSGDRQFLGFNLPVAMPADTDKAQEQTTKMVALVRAIAGIVNGKQ